MDDLDPEIKDGDEEIDGDIEDELIPGIKKQKGSKDTDEVSINDLEEEEEAVLPEDSFDDIDLW